MKSLMLLIGVCLIVLLLSAVAAGLNDFRSTEYTEAHGAVVTAGGVTTGNVTLTQDLFEDRTAEVVSVTSSLATDVPLVTSYTASTNMLLLSGLTAGSSRTLTVVYKIGNLTDYWGVDLAARTVLTFLILGVIGLVAAAVYQATRRD